MTIRELDNNDITDAMSLVWEVFSEFEAPEYAPQGVEEFRRFTESGAIAARMDSGEVRLWGSFEGETLTGVVAVRGLCHISLLFVKKQFHRRGFAKALFETVKKECSKAGTKEITVNSSPYAVEAYRRLGFEALDTQKELNGIKFTPMKCVI